MIHSFSIKNNFYNKIDFRLSYFRLVMGNIFAWHPKFRSFLIYQPNAINQKPIMMKLRLFLLLKVCVYVCSFYVISYSPVEGIGHELQAQNSKVT